MTRGILAAMILAAGLPGCLPARAEEPEEPATVPTAPGPAGSTEPEPPAGEPAQVAKVPVYLLDRLAAGASLGYFDDPDNSRILSEVHFDFPFIVIRQKSVYVRGSLQTSTVRTGDRIRFDAFEAQDFEYLIEAGARDYLNNRIAIAAFFGQQGREQLDQQGSRSIFYSGLGFESVGFPRPGGDNALEWRLAFGPTLQSTGVEADAVLRGAVLFDLWRGSRSSVGIDASFDSIFDGLQGQTEYRIGPRWTFPLPNGVRATLFAEWIRGQNPLLLDTLQGWAYGFRYTEGAYSGPHTLILPDVRGVIGFGLGSDRTVSRLDVDLASPEAHIFSVPYRVVANLDAHLIGGAGDTDTLYYIATAGFDLRLAPRVLLGPAIYHRSNHVIGQTGPLPEGEEPTSFNAIQVIARTPGWDFADRLPGRLMPGPERTWLDRVEGMIAPGVVTDSSFTDARSFDLQAGVRADLLGRSKRLVPFVRGFGQWGDTHRSELSVGFSTPQNLVLELRYRRDNQILGGDREDLYLMGSLFF